MSDLIENGEPTAVIVGTNPYNTYGLATQGFVWAAISSVSGNFDGRVKSVNEIEPDSTGNVNVTSIRTEDYSGDVNEVRANLTALSGNVEYRILTNVDYKELHDYTNSSIEALSGDSSEKFEVLMAASGGWDDTQHKMESSSGDWDNTTSKVESASADWDSVYASVEATSGDWNSAYSVVENTSGDWDSAYSLVNGASGDWDNATSKMESSSGDWDSAYSVVENTSGDWDSVYSSVNGVSGNWDNATSKVESSSADWDNTTSKVESASADWDSVYASVNGVSGDWNDATSKVESSSGNWDSVYSSVNGASGDWDSVYNTVNTVSSDYYTIEETDKAIDRLAAYYITCDAEGHAFDHLSSLLDAEVLYSGGKPRVPTRNDYAVVLSDESNGGAEWRYIFATAETTSTTGQWEPQYPIESNEYQALSNKPQINGVELLGNKSGTEFGLRNLSNLAYGDGDSLALTSELESVSSDMYSVYTTVQNTSGNWDSAYSSMNGASGDWDSVYNEFSSMSADIAQKCIPAVSGNLASLGADGDIEDSGKTVTFFGLYCEADAEAAENIFSAIPVSGEDFTSDDLVDGTRAYVNFAKGCNIDSPKLKIGTSDACPIYRYGTTAALKNAWVDNQTVEFIFNSDNSAWYMLTPAVGSSDAYGVLKTSPKTAIISNVSYSDNSRAVTPAAMNKFLSAAMSTPEFNEETAYAKDALVVYKPDGSSIAGLYVFTKAHAAGPWKGDSAATGDVRRVADYHVDSTPTADSSNTVTSDGVYKALSQRLNQSFAAPSFDTASAYAVGDRATYLGDPYEFTSPKTTGDWNDNIVKKLTIADFMSTDSMPMSMLADEFDDSAIYDAGEYVLYDSKLYRVIRPHDPEEGFNKDFELVPTLGEDLYLTYYTALNALVDTDNILNTQKVGLTTAAYASWPKDHIPAFSNTNATSKPVRLKDSGYTTSDFAAASAIASLFSPLSTYSVGDVVMHNCGMYVCSADVDEPHDWTGSANWMSTTVKDEITAIGNLVGNKADKPETFTEGNLAALDSQGNPVDSGVAKSDVESLLFAQYYPDGSVKSAAEFTSDIKYTLTSNASERTAMVRPFCNIDGTAENDNSSLVGCVVIPPFVDASGNGYISDDGSRYKVIGVGGVSGAPAGDSTKLTGIIAPNTVTNIGSRAFSKCTVLTSVSFPAATDIGDRAFLDCTALAFVSFPAATTIFDYAFSSCAVSSVSLPAATNIKAWAFAGCSKLVSVSLPAATEIRARAFNNCNNLTLVDFGDMPRPSVPMLGVDAFNSVPATCKIIVPYTQYDAWTTASGWSALPQEFVRHAEKADKPAAFTEGNLAKFNANGNPADSGKKPADFATAEQGAKAETSVQLVQDLNGNKTAVTVGDRRSGVAVGPVSLAVGADTDAAGMGSLANGYGTTAAGYISHAEGNNTTASGKASHAEGTDTEASGLVSHAEGNYTTAAGTGAHTEGMFSKASGVAAHAEGSNLDKLADLLQSAGAPEATVELFRSAATSAAGSFSHTEGLVSATSQMGSHAQGFRASDNGKQFSFVWQGYNGAVPTAAQMQALLDDPTSQDAQIALQCLVTALNARAAYTSKGPGTFCVNPSPVGGSTDPKSGFFVGDESLADALKVQRIYNEAVTDALDDKGQLYKSATQGNHFTIGGVVYPYYTMTGSQYRYKGPGNQASDYLYDPATGDLIYAANGAVRASCTPHLNPTENGVDLAPQPITGWSITFTPKETYLDTSPYAHFSLESIPEREYSNTSTYAVGDLVKYRSPSSAPYKAYRCNTAITTAESWNSAHWTEIKVLSQKQDALTFDSIPTSGSQNPVTSDGIKAALNQKQDALTVDSVPTSGSQNPISSGGVYDILQFEKWYPDGSIKSEADFPENTADIKYGTPDTTNKTIGVLTFCDTSSGENNSALTGRVVVPPYKDVDGVRYTVTEISGGSGTYNNKQSLSELILPSTVTKIDDGGVRGCTALTSTYAPSVEHVGSYAFYSCTSLSNVYMPSVEKVETAAFQFAALSSLSLPSVTSVEASAFYYSTSLTSVSLPMAKKIGSGAFNYCSRLSYASLPSLTGVSTDTFTMCTNLSHVEVPSVSSISDRAFSGCRHLSCLDFGNSLNTVPTLANVNAFGEVPSSCIVLVPDAQYDNWVSAENWSNLCFPQRLDFHRWSDWREAKKYEVAKKADYRKVQSTTATLQPSDVWVYNDIVLKPHPTEEMYWKSDEIPGYTELSLFYEEGYWFLYGMDLPDWEYEFAADASATSLNFNGSKGRRNLYRYGSYSTADVVYQGESLPNPYPLRIAKKGYDHEADFEGTLYDGSEQVTIKVGNSDTAGVILLSDALDSTHGVSKGTAATPYAVKQLNDSKFDKTGGDIKGTIRVKKPTGLSTSYTTITDSYIFTPASITVGGISTSLGITPTKVNVFNEALNIDADIYFPSTSGTLALTADIPDVSGLARKAAKPTEGNLAALDSEGNPTNSGKKPADFATAEQGAKAETSVQLVLDNANPSAKTAVTVGVRSTVDAADRGQASLTVGDHPKASGKNAVATGTWTQATGQDAHAEGNLSQATNYGAHAEGDNTRATGAYSHAEGTDTEASGLVSHAEGNYTTASGTGAHSEGMFAMASGVAAHAEGSNLDKLAALLQAAGADQQIVALFTNAATDAAGSFSHTEGLVSATSQMGSHAQGFRASDNGKQFSFVWQGYNGAVPTAAQMQALLDDPTSQDAQIALQCLVTALTNRLVYKSKGPGTFCINPEPDPNDADDDAASGFFIGDTSLKSRLKPLANESWKMPQYPNGEQLATAVKKIWQALGGSFEE